MKLRNALITNIKKISKDIPKHTKSKAIQVRLHVTLYKDLRRYNGKECSTSPVS